MDAVSPGNIFLFDRFRLDRGAGGLFDLDGGAPVAIGSRALDILGVLVERPGDLVAKNEIMDAVWPEIVVEEGNLTVQISALRRILDHGRAEGSCIQTIAGRGYRFVGTVSRCDDAGQACVTATPRDGNGADRTTDQGPPGTIVYEETAVDGSRSHFSSSVLDAGGALPPA